MANIKPVHVCQGMCFKAHEKEDPEKDHHPAKRSAAISHWKKALSCFFHTTQKWNEGSQTGNPTQLTLVNKLIEAMKRQEMRGNDSESQADRALTQNECHWIQELLQAWDDARTTAMMNFQHHLIARMDDVAHVEKETTKAGSMCRFKIPLDLNGLICCLSFHLSIHRQAQSSLSFSPLGLFGQRTSKTNQIFQSKSSCLRWIQERVSA